VANAIAAAPISDNLLDSFFIPSFFINATIINVNV
jgi:hypothetical protein